MSENVFATNKKRITVAAFTLVVWDLFEGRKKLRKEEAGTLECGLGPRSPTTQLSITVQQSGREPGNILQVSHIRKELNCLWVQ